MNPEIKAYAGLIDSHLSQMIERLQKIPSDRYDWTPDPAAPTPLGIATVTCEWLIADRLHVEVADPTLHPSIDVPVGFDELCAALGEERRRWHDLLAGLDSLPFREGPGVGSDPSTLNSPRYHFGVFPRDVRFMIIHIAQQVIYKNGQLSTLFFALKLDGDGPFTAPSPRDEYQTLSAAMSDPILHAALTDQHDLSEVTESVNQLGPTGHTPLKLSVLRDNAPLVRRLVSLGADPNEADEYGCTLLMYAAFTHRRYSGQALIDSGANVDAVNRWGITALEYARMEQNSALIEALTALSG